MAHRLEVTNDDGLAVQMRSSGWWEVSSFGFTGLRVSGLKLSGVLGLRVERGAPTGPDRGRGVPSEEGIIQGRCP